MDKIYSFIPKKTFLLIAVLFVGVITLGLVLSFNKRPKNIVLPPEPVISQAPSALSPLQKSIIGKTLIEDVEKSYPDAKKQFLSSGDPAYSINSTLDTRPDQVVFHNNIAKFERTVVIGNATTPTNLKISTLVLKYGSAEKIIRGSKFYGGHMETHIYPNKGLAFIANPNTDEVYEIQTFTPTTLDDYLTNYGEDIHEYGEIKE